MQAELATLTWFERFAFRVMRFFNTGVGRHPARLWQRYVLLPLVRLLVGRRVEPHGVERLANVPRDGPVLLVANHRTFFDQFVLGWYMLHRAGFRQRISF